MRKFLQFAAVSGIGWLCDAAVFALMLGWIGLPPAAANVISSYVGLTFVYVTSLRFVFRKNDERRVRFLLIYWAYQFVSILGYSFVIGRLAPVLPDLVPGGLTPAWAGAAAKIIVTPVNLCTNFLFLRLLSSRMADAAARPAGSAIAQPD